MKTFFNKKFQTKFLNTLGSMGEPLAPSVAEWYSKTFSKKKKCIVNTYFQTETGGIIASPKFNEKIENIPHGSVGKLVNNKIKLSPLFKNRKLEIKIQNTWPGCMKKILNKGDTWQKYWDKNNHFRLFDLATIQNNNIFIHGRTDDVINIRGHRIGSEELESIILKINGVIECCAISQVDEIEGNSIFFFISSRKNKIDEQINDKIIKNFGSFALPKKIYYLSELPKTRSGKILRRLLRTILTNPSSTNYGDLSTMLNKDIISEIKLTLLHDGR